MLAQLDPITFDPKTTLADVKTIGGLGIAKNEALCELEWRFVNHDYTYMMSDDHRYWRRGVENFNRINELMSEFIGTPLEDEARDVWKEYFSAYGLK